MAGQVKTLVVNGDDFGLSESINQGILSAFRTGILRSTSLMPNGDAFEDAVRIAKDAPDLGVGVHISLVGEKPVAPASDLGAMVGEDGMLPENYSTFARQFVSKRITAAQVHTEILAQIDKVLAAGIEPTHIDSHQHLHMLPGIFEVVIGEALRAGIPVIRIPLEQDGPGKHSFGIRAIQTWVLSRICKARLKLVRDAGLNSADWFWGLGVSGKMDEGNLHETLRRLGPGVNEIMCHPGVSDAQTSEKYQWGYSWDDEMIALQSESVRRYIEDNNIRLANFADAWQ